MGRTPDAYDGPRIDEAIIWEEQSSDPSEDLRQHLVQAKGLMIFIDGKVIPIGEMRAATWQHPVDEVNVNTPPGSPSTGYRVVVGSSPTGVFVGHGGKIAQWNGTAWVFSTPKQGSMVANKNDTHPYKQQASGSPWDWVLNTANAVQLQGRAVHTAAPTDKQIVTWNSSESRWEPTDFESVEPFGSWHDKFQNPDQLSTTGSSWVEAGNIAYPSDLPLGNYAIICTYVVSGSSSATQIGVRQTFDGSELCSFVLKPVASNTHMVLTGIHTQTAISGSHTYKIWFNKDGGAGTSYCENRAILTWRLS